MKILCYSEELGIEEELLAAASELKGQDPSAAAHLGPGLKEIAPRLKAAGADLIYCVEEVPAIEGGVEPLTDALEAMALEFSPSLILIGGTRRGRELAPRLATRLGTGCVADCTRLILEGDSGLIMERLAYAGKARAYLSCRGRPIVCTVKPHAYEKLRREGGGPEPPIIRLSPSIKPSRLRVLGFKERSKGGVRLDEARIIVSVGRGLKKREDLGMIRELADVLNAEVGCSRPLASELGWLSEEHHIGISGISVKPQLYLAIGISGQLHHLVGIKDSKLIASINIDREAPIFSASDYCIVGDLYQVVPELIGALKALLGGPRAAER